MCLRRLTLGSLENLRDEMVVAGVRCNRNKTQIVLSSLMRKLLRGGKRSVEAYLRMFAATEASDPESHVILERCDRLCSLLAALPRS